jgi:acetyl esterase/lipase
MNRLRHDLSFLVAALLLTPCVALPAQIPSDPLANVEIHRNLEYANINGHSLQLDLAVPKEGARPFPLIIYIHGGGWKAGDKGDRRARPFLTMGYAVASINYRLSNEAIFPAQIYDCKAAVRWLRAHATGYGLNPDKFGAWGDSAGGHLVALLGTTAGHLELEGDEGNAGISSQVQAVCDFYGPTDFLKMNSKTAHDAISQLLGGPIDQNKDKAIAASPINYVSAKSCPFLIETGDADTLVPVEQSVELNDALQKAGVESTLHIVKNGPHEFKDQPAFDLLVAFFHKHLQ